MWLYRCYSRLIALIIATVVCILLIWMTSTIISVSSISPLLKGSSHHRSEYLLLLAVCSVTPIILLLVWGQFCLVYLCLEGRSLVYRNWRGKTMMISMDDIIASSLRRVCPWYISQPYSELRIGIGAAPMDTSMQWITLYAGDERVAQILNKAVVHSAVLSGPEFRTELFGPRLATVTESWLWTKQPGWQPRDRYRSPLGAAESGPRRRGRRGKRSRTGGSKGQTHVTLYDRPGPQCTGACDDDDPCQWHAGENGL